MSASYSLRHFLTPYGIGAVLVVLIVDAVLDVVLTVLAVLTVEAVLDVVVTVVVVVVVEVVVVVVETATESKLSFLIWGP